VIRALLGVGALVGTHEGYDVGGDLGGAVQRAGGESMGLVNQRQGGHNVQRVVKTWKGSQ